MDNQNPATLTINTRHNIKRTTRAGPDTEHHSLMGHQIILAWCKGGQRLYVVESRCVLSGVGYYILSAYAISLLALYPTQNYPEYVQALRLNQCRVQGGGASGSIKKNTLCSQRSSSLLLLAATTKETVRVSIPVPTNCHLATTSDQQDNGDTPR